MPASFDPALTGQINATLGPLFLAMTTSRTAADRFTQIGFDPKDGAGRYYAWRCGPLGRATPETVIALFFNFSPQSVRRNIPRVWDIASPEAALDALVDAADAMMRETLGDLADAPELRELAALLTDAAATAFTHPEGRALFAGIAAIPWPDSPPAQVWLGMHALREFRGDGHVAALTASGLTGLEALVLHGAILPFPAEGLRTSRQWSQEEWDATVDDLRARGLLQADDVLVTDHGQAFRDEIERQTDELAMPAYATIGEAGVTRILELAPPIVQTVSSTSGDLARLIAERAAANDA